MVKNKRNSTSQRSCPGSPCLNTGTIFPSLDNELGKRSLKKQYQFFENGRAIME